MGKQPRADERAKAALAENPFLSIAGLMKTARVSSTFAIRALRDHTPPGAAVSAPTAAPSAPAPRRGSNGLRAREARALVQAQIADGPKPGAQIEAAAKAAAIPARTLLAAADELNVRTRRGEWFLPH
jgi:hypothetical protein